MDRYAIRIQSKQGHADVLLVCGRLLSERLKLLNMFYTKLSLYSFGAREEAQLLALWD